jgi:predicted DNA-binding protein
MAEVIKFRPRKAACQLDEVSNSLDDLSVNLGKLVAAAEHRLKFVAHLIDAMEDPAISARLAGERLELLNSLYVVRAEIEEKLEEMRGMCE